MSSHHHSQQLSDPNFIRLQNLRLNDDPASGAIQISHRRTSSLNGTADSEHGLSGKTQLASSNRMPTIDDDFKLYDQNKFITASKFTGPKLPAANAMPSASPKHQLHAVKAPIGFRNSASPTHSLGGMSQHSVYENIDHYSPSITQQPLPPPPSYSHYVSSGKSAIGCGTYEVIGKKYDPSDSGLSRFTHTPQPDEMDPSHIYENLGNVPPSKWMIAHIYSLTRKTDYIHRVLNNVMMAFFSCTQGNARRRRAFRRRCPRNRSHPFTLNSRWTTTHPAHTCSRS